MGSCHSVPEVALPSELSMPFSLDSDHVPEIIVPRQVFQFYISSNRSYCLVGYTLYSAEQAKKGRNSEEGKSFFSVVSVHDTYGLKIAGSYLEHLKRMSKTLSEIELYLECSLTVLGLTIVSPRLGTGDRVSTLCARLLLELKRIEEQQPKMVGQLERVNVELPLEILAKIIRSNRVSKVIRAQHTSTSNSILLSPSYYQMMKYEHIYCWTSVDAYDNYILVTPHALDCQALALDRQRMIATWCRKWPGDMSWTVVQHSLICYESYLESRGQDTRAFILAKLLDLEKRLFPITSDNISEVCTWIVQLTYDCGQKMKERSDSLNIEEMERELKRLITITIQRWNGR